MSVAGYSVVGHKDFFINSSGVLKERDQYGSVLTLASSVSQVSALQAENPVYPSARADVLFLNGNLKQWDDAAGWKDIAGAVKQVSAGWNGDSAVLFNWGQLDLYNTDASSLGAWTWVSSGISSASLGLDLYNAQSMVGMVTTNGICNTWERWGGLHYLASGVAQVSCGTQSNVAVLFIGGYVYDHQDSFTGSGTWTYLCHSGASVSCGEDGMGMAVIDVVYSDAAMAAAYHYNGASNPWYYTYLGSNVVEADAGIGGVFYLSYSSGFIAGETGGYYNPFLGSFVPVTTTWTYYSSSASSASSSNIWMG
jgi:hypothetical protein